MLGELLNILASNFGEIGAVWRILGRDDDARELSLLRLAKQREVRVAAWRDVPPFGGGNDHTVDEWIDLPTLAMQTKRAAVLMHRLARRPGA